MPGQNPGGGIHQGLDCLDRQRHTDTMNGWLANWAALRVLGTLPLWVAGAAHEPEVRAMRISLPILALGCLLYAGSGLAASLDVGSTGDHVRVILDTSKSMCGAACGWQDPPNDPGRLSILSTLLLHDLLKPDPNKAENPDSFAVIPFGQEKWIDGPPPTSQATPRRAKGMAARSAFADELRAARLPFDAMNTYYSPSIEQALNDLPPLTPESSEATTRTIVLITDGRSVLPDADAAYIKDQLLPKLAAMQTRLYVIMFGPDARQYGEAFFRDIEQADADNASAGRYAQRVFPSPAFIVDTGKELPETMIRLFSESGLSARGDSRAA